MRPIKYAEGVFAFDREPEVPGAESVTADELRSSGWDPDLVEALAEFLPSRNPRTQATGTPASEMKSTRTGDDRRDA